MNSHFCKVGKVRPSFTEAVSIIELEKKYLNFIEEAYNLIQTDASLSDVLYYEAYKLKKNMLLLNQYE